MSPRVFFLCLLGLLYNTSLVAQQCGLDGRVYPDKMRLDSLLLVRKSKNLYRTEIQIPVVVHIVWNSPDENISDEQVISQIKALNRDFNAENEDVSYVPEAFRPFIARQGIRFCLAAENPQGQATTGIVRVQTNQERIGISSNLYDTAKGGSNAWDTDRYLNIWVANVGNAITGFGTYPGVVDSSQQGVVVHPRYFGHNNSARYHLGRVAVHEIGHFLGLYHTWGDASDCTLGDQVEDTPPQQHYYTGCPAYPQESCGHSNMFMNYMDYVDDDCMYMFTQGQMERMILTLEVFRPRLGQSNIACVSLDQVADSLVFSVYPNPASDYIRIDFSDTVSVFGGIICYHATGAVCFTYEGHLHNQMTIDLPALPAGIYWLRIGKCMRKLIIG